MSLMVRAKNAVYAACESADQHMLRSRAGRAYGIVRAAVAALPGCVQIVKDDPTYRKWDVINLGKSQLATGVGAAISLYAGSYGYVIGVVSGLAGAALGSKTVRNDPTNSIKQGFWVGTIAGMEGNFWTPSLACLKNLGLLAAKKIGNWEAPSGTLPGFLLTLHSRYENGISWELKKLLSSGSFILGGPLATVVLHTTINPLRLLVRNYAHDFSREFENNQECLEMLRCRIAIMTGDKSIVHPDLLELVECRMALNADLRSVVWSFVEQDIEATETLT